MDADSPLVSRLERTFWTVWYYISGAVHRLLRPEQENSVSNNPSSLQDSAVDSELAKCHHEDEARGGEVQEEPTLSTATPLSSAHTAVAWDLSTSEIDLAPDENKIQDTADLKDSQTDVGTREEECVPTGDGESQLLVPEYNKAEKGGGVYQEVYTHRQAETLEDDKDDESMITRSQTADIASSIEETERVETPDFQSVEDTPVKVQDQEENALNFETDSVEIELSTTTGLCPKEEVSVHKEEAVWQRNMVEAEISKKVSLFASRTENKSDEDTLRDDTEDFVDGELQTTSNTSVLVSEDEPIAAELEFAMAPRNSSNESDSVDERMNSPVEEEGQEVVIEDERVNKAEVPEHKGEIHTVTGDSKEEVNSSAPVWCISDTLLHAETELHVEKRLKDVVDVQIMITEIGDETLSSGAATNEKAAVKLSSVPADDHTSQVSEDSNGKTGQEVSWGVTGQSVDTQEPKPPTCGGPEDITEPEPDENPAQSLLEVGDPEKVWSPVLPGEVENQEPDSLHKSDSSTEALSMRERTEQGQESDDERESDLDLTASEVQHETQKLHVDTLVQEAGFIPEEKNRELLVSSLRTEIDDSDKESEADFSLTGEKDLQDREEDVLIEMNREELDPNEADAPGRFMETEDLDAEETVRLPEAGDQTVKTGRQESADAVRSGQSIGKTLSLIQDITATEFLEQSVATEPEQQYTVTDLEKATNGVEQSAAEVEVGPELGSAECPETALSNEKDTKTHEGLNSEESGSVSDTETSLSTAESGFSDQAISDRGTPNGESQGSVQDMFGNVSEPNSPSFPKLSPQQCDSDCQDTLMRGTDEAGQSSLKDKEPVTGLCFDSAEAENLNQESEETKDDTDEDRGSQEEVNTEEKGLLEKTSLKTSDDIDVMTLIEVSTSFRVQIDQMDTEALVTFSDSQDESEHTESACAGSSSDVWSEEGISSTEPSSHDDTSVESEKGSLELPSLDKLKCLGDIQTSDEEDQLTTKSEHQNQADVSALDFTAQRSRIAVKNPQVRPPKDPRSLILMSSLDPTPDPHLPGKLPLGGMGIGIKLPGLGAGFPVLKKTQQKDEARPESLQKESETRSEETSDSPKQDEEQHERKWMPPRHPGFGNPLMSELKTRLNKTTKD